MHDEYISPDDLAAGRYGYIYLWQHQGRRHQRCRVLARGTMYTCLVEFPDGYRMVTSINGLKEVGSSAPDAP